MQVKQSDDALKSVDLDVAISHHGIDGMRWGIWNEETRRRYLGLSRSKAAMASVSKGVKTAASKAGDAAVKFMREKAAKHKVNKSARVEARNKAKIEKIEARKQAKIEAKQQREEIRQHRKETGMSPDEYYALRKKTLMSHDPEVVMKGMKTLTDKELADKIQRLKQEAIIEDMANNYSLHASRKAKARAEAIAANPVVKLGTDFASAALTSALNSAFGGKGKKNGGGKKNQNNQSNGNNQVDRENSNISNSGDSGSNSRASVIDQIASSTLFRSPTASSNAVTAESSPSKTSFERSPSEVAKAMRDQEKQMRSLASQNMDSLRPPSYNSKLYEPPKPSVKQQEKAEAKASAAFQRRISNSPSLVGTTTPREPISSKLLEPPKPSISQQEKEKARADKIDFILSTTPVSSGLSPSEMNDLKKYKND